MCSGKGVCIFMHVCTYHFLSLSLSMGVTSSLLSFLLFFPLLLLFTFLIPTPTATPSRHQPPDTATKRRKKPPPDSPQRPSSWEFLKGILTCKQLDRDDVHDPTTAKKKKKKNRILPTTGSSPTKGGYAKLATCSSLCTMSDVKDPRVVRRNDSSSSPEPTLRLGSSRKHEPTSPLVGRRMPLRGLAGCYECRAVVDPSSYPSVRPALCVCPDCGEVFLKPDSLEAHQAVRHAVSELGQDDSGRNIVEIIFRSSWLKKDSSICRVDRILKVHNTAKTISRFEGYREAVKSTVSRLNARCVADGNELLRFYCTTFACSIGSRGSTSLCGSGPCCGVCNAIRHGFGSKMDGEKALCTTATSGRAHDCMVATNEEKAAAQGRRAMLVCRVIAGRVCKSGSKTFLDSKEQEQESSTDGSSGSASQRFDSIAGSVGVYSNLDELYVFDPRAILPCFVVIYRIQDPLVDHASKNHATKAGAPLLDIKS